LARGDFRWVQRFTPLLADARQGTGGPVAADPLPVHSTVVVSAPIETRTGSA
jgi:hypothetical protein